MNKSCEMGAKSDALQLAVLMALCAAGLQYLRYVLVLHPAGCESTPVSRSQSSLVGRTTLKVPEQIHSRGRICRSTPAGEDILETSRRALLGILIPSHTAAGLHDYVEVPVHSNDAQPDAVRKAARTVDPAGHEMKCDEEIPAYSSVTTNNVQIFAQGFYKGAESGEHWWMYRIEFKNVGRQRVQLLARHWVFVDSNGKTVEVKGPGARGLTPKISPGRTFKYESGTPLATSTGSMYGSFQFQVLRLQDGSKPETPIYFSARVGRLALTPDNTPAKVPCGEEASEGLVPLTSVWATDRVIVGVTSSYISPEEAEEVYGGSQLEGDASGLGDYKEKHTFLLDVQVNNGRDDTITIKRVHWAARNDPSKRELMKPGVVISLSGEMTPEPLVMERKFNIKVTHEGVPRGPAKHSEYALSAGEALRYEDKIVIPSSSALLEGRMEVEVDVGDDEESDEDLYMYKVHHVCVYQCVRV